MAKANNRTVKKATFGIRVGGGKRGKRAWYRRTRSWLFVLAFAVVGTVLIVLTHANSQPNCSSFASGKNSLELCVNIADNTNYLNAKADYLGLNKNDTLSSGSISLYQCDGTSLACTVMTSSSRVNRPGIFSKKTDSSLIAPTSRNFVAGGVYRACVSFVSGNGWSMKDACTSYITFGNGFQDGAKVYVPPSSSGSKTTPSPPTSSGPPAATCGGETVTKSDGSAWVCTFSDEFSGTDLDRTLWLPQTTAASGFATPDTKDGNARACYMDNPANISVSSGLLNLTAVQAAAPFTCSSPTGSFTTSYTSGEVTTYNKFSQQYGRFEVSAKLPTTTQKGLQETLWLWPNNDVKYGAWPASGEVDFAEFYSKYANFTVPYIHYLYNLSSTSFSTHTNVPTPVYGYDSNFNNCYLNSGAFNTYTAVWQAGYIELDVNGKPCVVDNYNSTSAPDPAPFDQPFFLALTQALGIWPVDKSGNHQGASSDNAFVPGSTPLPATTQVDYVRVWK